jgi:ubiquinone/menaquinone biosynthesis C-methylase UbiE
MIKMLNEKKAKGAPWERVKATVIDSRDVEIFQDGMFTYIYMNFSLFFISHARKAVVEIHRTLMPNGTAFITTLAAVRPCATSSARTASGTA